RTPVPVSVALDGSSGNNNSGSTAISADGRFVAFSSDAANLAPGDTNNKTDVFLGRTGFNAPSPAASASPSAAAKPTTSAADLKRNAATVEFSSSRAVRSSSFNPGRARSFSGMLLGLP